MTVGPPLAASVYAMRMARVNISVSDELLKHARAAGLNISRLAATALAEELDRRAKLTELDSLLAGLDAEFGPIPAHEAEEARAWADRALSAPGSASTADRRSRTT
jgi:Post-segregation antitoxin CcdA